MNELIENFIFALFEHLNVELLIGYIEIRLLDDTKRDQKVISRFYRSPAELIENLPSICRYAVNNSLGVFVGVLPRTRRRGKSKDTIFGYAVWLDMDLKNFPGGKEELLRTLMQFPLPPTVIVSSGHGYHAYWFMKEPQEPSVLSGISKRLGYALKGDNIHDPARVMRVPGSKNFKDPTNPKSVAIESIDLSIRYDPMDFDEILQVHSEEDSGKHSEATEKPDCKLIIRDHVSERVQDLIENHARIRNFFHGKGKPVKNAEGTPLDTTSSGYDFSLALELARKGITERSELATAIWNRPDDAARAKGKDYIKLTVEKALALAARFQNGSLKKGKVKFEGLNFEVSSIKVFDSNPPLYELTIFGTPIILSTRDLISMPRFKVRYIDAMRHLPKMPPNAAEWDNIVSEWLKRAEIVELPPEASDTGMLRDEISHAIENLACGETVEDLDQGKALQHEDILIFKTRTILRYLKETGFQEIRANMLCSNLRDLGFESRSFRLSDRVVRAWGITKRSSGDGKDVSSEAEEEK